MAKKIAKAAGMKKRSTVARRSPSKTGGPPLLDRFRKEAESLEKKLRTSADKTVREIEKQFLHQVHAATEDQVKRLEKRVVALEKTVKEYDRRVRGLGVL